MIDILGIGGKEIIGALAGLLGFCGYIPYFINIFRGKTKPHIFSWFIWGLLTAISWAAQYADNAGPGAWATGFTALSCFAITILSLKHGEKNITRSDWIAFLAALSAIPLWYFTNDPLWAVVLITLIDMVAFYPTFRKSWNKPGDETLVAYGLSAAKFALALTAMNNVTLVTTLYPASLVVMNSLFVIMALMRRQMILNHFTPLSGDVRNHHD